MQSHPPVGEQDRNYSRHAPFMDPDPSTKFADYWNAILDLREYNKHFQLHIFLTGGWDCKFKLSHPVSICESWRLVVWIAKIGVRKQKAVRGHIEDSSFSSFISDHVVPPNCVDDWTEIGVLILCGLWHCSSSLKQSYATPATHGYTEWGLLSMCSFFFNGPCFFD